jgi:hypothetical protein
LRDQCGYLGIPFFMKQMSKKGAIPQDLFVRQFPKSQRAPRDLLFRNLGAAE